MGYTVNIQTNGQTKRIKTFIGKDGVIYEGGIEAHLGGIGRPNSVPEEPGKAEADKKE